MKKLLLSLMVIFLFSGCSKEEVKEKTKEEVKEEVIEKEEIKVADFLKDYTFIEKESNEKLLIYRGKGSIDETFEKLKKDIIQKGYIEQTVEEEEKIYNNNKEGYFKNDKHTLLIDVKDIDDSQIEIKYEVK